MMQTPALVLLWANTATNCGSMEDSMDDVKHCAKLLCTDSLDEARNVDAYRAAPTHSDFTIQAAVCLCNCHLFSETLVDRAGVLCALLQLAPSLSAVRGALTFGM